MRGAGSHWAVRGPGTRSRFWSSFGEPQPADHTPYLSKSSKSEALSAFAGSTTVTPVFIPPKAPIAHPTPSASPSPRRPLACILRSAQRPGRLAQGVCGDCVPHLAGLPAGLLGSHHGGGLVRASPERGPGAAGSCSDLRRAGRHRRRAWGSRNRGSRREIAAGKYPKSLEDVCPPVQGAW